MQTVLFTCVHYHNAADVRRFAAHVRAAPWPEGWGPAFAVADNGGDAGEGFGGDVLVVRPGRNAGYLNGCAAAFEAWRAENGTPPWTVVSNTDLTFSAGFFEAMLGTPWPDDVGLVGPDVRRASGVRQNPFLRRRPSALRMRGYAVLYARPWLTRAYTLLHRVKAAARLRFGAGREAVDRDEGVGRETIYAPHGSVVLVRRAFFEGGGTLPHALFMHLEEIHLAEQARAAGVRVVWAPGLDVRHAAGGTTRAVPFADHLSWKRESARLLYRDYFA